MTKADQQRGLISEEEKKGAFAFLSPVRTRTTMNLRRLKEITNGKGKPELEYLKATQAR